MLLLDAATLNCKCTPMQQSSKVRPLVVYNTVKNKTLRLSITLYLSVWTLRNRDKPLESEFDSVVEVHTLRDKVKTFLYRDSSLMNRDISLNLLRCQGVTTQTLLNHIQNIVIQKTSIDIAIKKPCFNSRMNICSMVLISTKI